MNNFFWSYIKKVIESGGYGMLYNWFCTQEQAAVEYGYLYNWYAATDSRGFVSGWHLPTIADMDILKSFVSSDGNSLRTVGTTYWNTSGGTNTYGFNGRGSGSRSFVDGSFSELKAFLKMWVSDNPPGSPTNRYYYINSSGIISYVDITEPGKKAGNSIRLLCDSSTDPGSVTIDGVIYPTVKIGTQVWLAANLMAKHYANGDAIPEVTSNTAWAALTTGSRCSYNNLESNAGTTKKLSSSDEWVVPTAVQLLNTSLPDYNVSKLMEAGFTHWNESNIGTNTTGFGLVGTGYRSDVDGIFNSLKGTCHVWISNLTDGTAFIFISGNTDATASSGINMGRTIRLCNPATTHADGYVGSYTQNDGTTIPTIVINGVEWTMNLRETKWSDGSDIPNVTDNTAWSLLKSAACCDINNDPTNR